MKSSALLMLACLLTCVAPLGAQTDAPPIDEDAIVLEVERLLEEQAPLDQAGLEEVDQIIRKGIKDHDKHDYEAALVHYMKALELNPLSDLAHYEAAYTLQALGHQQKALDHLVRAITIDPKRAAYRSLKASILDNMGYPDLAITTFKDLIELDPGNYQAHLNLAITYLRLSRYPEAEADLLLAEKLQPEAASPQYHLSTAAQLQGFNYDEQARLQKFLELAGNDPRKEVAEERLKELMNFELKIDMEAPYSGVEMIVQLIRVGWKSNTHQETFPEARGYALTYEEERMVYADTLLPAWRKEKVKDPEASQPFYDMLLKIDDAGYLDEYIYYRNRKVFSESAEAWIAEHTDRIESFEAWATEEGLMAVPQKAAAEEVESGSTSLTLKLLTIATESELIYTMDINEEIDFSEAMEAERKAFAAAVSLDGPNRIKCRSAFKQLVEKGKAINATQFHQVFRCSQPGDEEWEAAVRMLSGLGLTLVDRSPPLAGSAYEAEGEYKVGTGKPDWMIYYLAKAIWRFEPGIREQYIGVGPYKPTFEEELLAWMALAESAFNSQTPTSDEELPEGAEPYEPDPYVAFLAELHEADLVQGFVLFEVLHKQYGISLDRLTENQADALQEYLNSFVLVAVRNLKK